MTMLIRRTGAAAAVAATSLALVSTAGAVDLRDWGRKYNTAGERYVVLASFNNEAVLDKETQLVWSRSARIPKLWDQAPRDCFGAYIGGRTGWRLPHISELQSLLGAGPVLPAGHPFQGIAAGAWFWSSTVYITTNAYVVNLSTGAFTTYAKAYMNPNLCVRGVGATE